jgi:hypothetical protein
MTPENGEILTAKRVASVDDAHTSPPFLTSFFVSKFRHFSESFILKWGPNMI